jgi:flagellar hook protein FlgE
MSINSAMLAGVAALRANSSALAAISNNIANMNTTSYKREVTNFADIVTSASSQKSYTAGGVSANTTQHISSVGSLESTTSTMDVGIDGQGFFVATEKSNPLTADPRVFTRAGSLSRDKDGFLKNADGFFVQGWLVDSDGVVTTDPSDLNKLSTINISSVGGTAEATTKASIVANLNSEQDLSSDLGTYSPSAPATAMATYDSSGVTGPGTKPDFEISIPVSDSKGGQRNLTLSVLRSATSNTWNAELWSPDITDAAGTGQLATGTLVFNSDGTLDTTNSTLMTALAGSSTINASGTTTTPRWNDTLGVAAQTLNIDLGGITQYASVSATSSVTANGTAFGNVKSVEIGKDGMVTAIFDNGVQRNIAQLALATFTNPDGLKGLSGNAFQVTTESGTYNLKVPGTGGSGKLVTSTLEASTVDLSAEFTGLITTQRAYSAASKIITTADEMIQELVNIKR